METFWADLLTVFVVTGLAGLSPGPNFATVVKNSLVHSRRAGVWTAVGVTGGNLPHVIFGLVGVTVIVSQSILLFNTLKWLGAAYLIYLGVRGLLAKRQDAVDVDLGPLGVAHDDMAATRAFWSSFLISALNPKVALFFLAFIPQFVRPAEGSVGLQFLALGAIFISVAFVIDLAYAFASGALGRLVSRSQRFATLQKRFAGFAYIALGAGAALTGNEGD